MRKKTSDLQAHESRIQGAKCRIKSQLISTTNAMNHSNKRTGLTTRGSSFAVKYRNKPPPAAMSDAQARSTPGTFATASEFAHFGRTIRARGAAGGGGATTGGGTQAHQQIMLHEIFVGGAPCRAQTQSDRGLVDLLT